MRADLSGREPATDIDAEPAAAPATSYSEYLRLPALLALQKPLARPPVHDELLFIIVHQAHELWFKQMLDELQALIADVDAGRLTSAGRGLYRLSAIVRLLGEHMAVLETMPPHEFARFRSVLGSASGLESEQFRRIERLAGLGALPLPSAAPAATETARSASLREACWRAVAAERPSIAALVTSAELDAAAFGRALVGALAEPQLSGLRGLIEQMLLFDEQMLLWRRRHFELARAMIGKSAGTGGSSGATYLRATMDRRFFPELWHWRER